MTTQICHKLPNWTSHRKLPNWTWWPDPTALYFVIAPSRLKARFSRKIHDLLPTRQTNGIITSRTDYVITLHMKLYLPTCSVSHNFLWRIIGFLLWWIFVITTLQTQNKSHFKLLWSIKRKKTIFLYLRLRWKFSARKLGSRSLSQVTKDFFKSHNFSLWKNDRFLRSKLKLWKR